MTLAKRRTGSETTKAEGPAGGKSLSDLARQPEVQLAVDNDACLRFAESVIYLRRLRNMTQHDLAQRIGTSQAAVARMEGAKENITLRTLERVVTALDGRLLLSIPPAEIHLPTLPNWWDLIEHKIEATKPYTCTVILKQEGSPVRVGAGWETEANAAVIGPVTIEVLPAQKKTLTIGQGRESKIA